MAFENKIPMCLDDNSLTYCQENPLVKIWKPSRTAYESVVDLGCQQFCKDFIKIFLKGFFWQVKGYLVLFYDIHKKILYILSGNSTNSCLALSNSFCVLKHKSFISLLHFLLYYWKWVSVFYFRETFFRNLKIVDWYTFGSMNWFAVDLNITLKSLLNMTFHETYMWLFLWPQELFLIEWSCKFIFFHMTSHTFSGSYDLRHFNWKVVWKPNWVNVLHKSEDTVLLYQLCCSRLVYLRCHLFSFHSVKPKSFDWRILLISY